MKRLFVILCTLVVAALIALKITLRKSEPATQTTPEAQPVERTQALPTRTLPGCPPTFQETNAVEKSPRQKLQEDSKYASVFAKEAQWKEKFKGLKKGMTVPEAVAVMGERPTFLLAAVNTNGTVQMLPVATNALQNVTSHAVLYYSPDGVSPVDLKAVPRLDRLSVDFFTLQFDIEGKLESMWDADEDPEQRLRRELSETDVGREMLTREAEWKEKSKALKEGMTMPEVIAVMGKPTQQEQMPTEIGEQSFLHYLPKGETSLFKMGGGSPLEDLTLTFDSNGKLKKINWH